MIQIVKNDAAVLRSGVQIGGATVPFVAICAGVAAVGTGLVAGIRKSKIAAIASAGSALAMGADLFIANKRQAGSAWLF